MIKPKKFQKYPLKIRKFLKNPKNLPAREAQRGGLRLRRQGDFGLISFIYPWFISRHGQGYRLHGAKSVNKG